MKNTRPAERPPLVKPRRMIGPDAVKALREYALKMTGNKYSYDACRVQRSRMGSISWNLDPEKMEYLGEGEPDTYGEFIRHDLIPMAERIEAHLSVMSEEQRLKEIDKMVRKVPSGDGYTYWLLSTRSLRRHLFPGAYDPVTGNRRDNLMYHWRPQDFRHAGKIIMLRSLRREDVETFTRKAMKLTNDEADLAHVTPVSLPNT